MIDVGDNEHPENKGSSPVQKWKREKPKPIKVDQPPESSCPEDEGYFKIFGEIANVTGQARRSEPDQLIAVVIPKKDIKCPEFRVAEVLGVDATCDISGDDRVSDLQYCEIEEIIIDGKPFDFQTDGRGIRKKSGSNGKPSGVYAVSLLSFSEGNPVNFSIKFTPSLGDPRSLIRLDIVDRTNDKEQTDAC